MKSGLFDDFDGKCAIVTGGASGIGYAVCKVLTDAGCQVYVLDKATPADRAAMHSSAAVDLSQIGDMRAALNDIPPVDYVVTAAGISGPTDIYEVTPELWDSIQAINARSIFFLIQSVAPRMRPGGAIVNVSSINGIESKNIRECPYNVSKAAVISLTRTWARALAPEIRVNCVCPGITDTPMLEGIFERDAADAGRSVDDLVNHYLERIPLGRVGNPSEIANAICYLLSDKSSYVTGQALPVCGGIV